MTRHCRRRGYTLIEVLLVLMLISTLMTLAVPSYKELRLRVHRTSAIATLVAIGTCMERWRSINGVYDDAACAQNPSGRYRFEFPAGGNESARQFRVVAVPTGPQTGDHCGTLGVDHLGTRTAGNPQADAGDCWLGR